MVICGCLAAGSLSAQEKAIPKELTEYVQLARKAGLSSAQIQDNAVKAGWPAEIVKAALASGNPVVAPGKAPASQPGQSPGTSAAPAVQPAGVPNAPSGTPAPPAVTATVAASPDEYVIGEGDVLGISVFGEPTASVPAVVVRPDGKISVPLLKDVAVAGLTPRQVEKVITNQLADIIRAPNVTVVVSGINSKKIYLLGAVKKEGPIPFTYRMTVLQAISEAGGLTDYAKRRKIYILRNENGKDYKLPFDYDAVIRGEHFELNIPLQPGDQIVVPH
jgi:polysaccharide biosynthesis/export protein